MENRKKNEYNNFNLESIINTNNTSSYNNESNIENQIDLNTNQITTDQEDDDENIQINVDEDDSLHSNANTNNYYLQEQNNNNENGFNRNFKRSFQHETNETGIKKFCNNYNQSVSSVSTNSSVDPPSLTYQAVLDNNTNNNSDVKVNLIESMSSPNENQKSTSNDIGHDDNNNNNNNNTNTNNQIANYFENSSSHLSENRVIPASPLDNATTQHLTNLLKAYQPLIKQCHQAMPLNVSPSPPQLSFNQQSSSEIKLPFIIDYFFIVHSISDNREIVKGKCKYCSYEFNCKMKPTSNFSKHAQIHEKLFAEYLIAKENIKLKKASELSTAASSSHSLIYSSSTNRKAIHSNQKKSSHNLQHNKQHNKDTIKLENQPQFNLSFHHSNSIVSSSSSTSSPLFSSTLKSDMSHYQQSKLSNNKLPLINNKYVSSTNFNNTQLKQTSENTKLSKFLINSLLPSSLLDTKTFNDLIIESFDSYQYHNRSDRLVQLKYSNQIIPNLVDVTEKRIQDIINTSLNLSNDSFCTINIDLFNDYFSFININDFNLNELINLQDLNNNLCLFVGFSLNFLNQNWNTINQTLGCLKLTPACLKNLINNENNKNSSTSKNNSIESFVYSKFIDLCKKYNIRSEKIYKIVMNNQSKCTLNMWQKFKYWSLPGLDILNEQFFDIDLDNNSMTNLFNNNYDENNEIIDIASFEDEEINMYDEYDSNNFNNKDCNYSKDLDPSGTDFNDKDSTFENNYNASINGSKRCQNDLNKLIDKTNKLDFIGDSNIRISCVIDILNTCVEEIMNYLFDSNNIIVNIMKKISKNFYSATCSQPKSKFLISNIFKIRNSIYSNSLPRWCQQFLLIKKIFKIDTNDVFKSTGNKKISHQRSPYLDSSFQQDSTSKWSAKLSNKENFVLKEFIFLLEPIYLMLIELLPNDLESTATCNGNEQNDFNQNNNSPNTNKFSKTISDSYHYNHNRNSKISKVLPCYKTLIFTYQKINFSINCFNDANKKLLQIIQNQLDFVVKDSSFKLASLLDPNFGTCFVPSIEKKQYEHFLIESVILNEEIYSQNQQQSLATSQYQNSSDLITQKYKYIYYDESFIDEPKNSINIYREEVASYLKHIRSNINLNNKLSTASSSNNSAFSLINSHFDFNQSTDPIRFWASNFKKWPYLARLSKKVFTVQVSNSGVERILNLEKNQFLSNHNDFRIIENILFLKCNQNLY
jgi:hypothetical protein